MIMRPDRHAGGAMHIWAWRLMVMLTLSVPVPLLLPGQAGAQSLRDPTVPPAAALPAEPVASAVRAADELGPLSVLIRDGNAFVVMGTRLYAQGNLLGKARIERITETEVWLREGKQLRKVQLFSGVSRRVAPAKPVAPDRP
jgi:hypothetical protein